MQKITPLNELEIEQVAGGPATTLISSLNRLSGASKIFNAGYEAGKALANAFR